MKRREAYLIVFDGLADWEPAHALCEINRSGDFDVITAGFSKAPIVTMAGLKLTPHTTISKIEPTNAAILILPGGEMWEKGRHETITKLLQRFHTSKILIGAICAATLQIARAGLTHGIRHTSNAKEYLKSMVPGYADEQSYVNELAVTDANVITASGLGSVEFAREVIRELKLHNEKDRQLWYDMFKHGVYPTLPSAGTSRKQVEVAKDRALG